MKIVLWILQVALALFMGSAGFAKVGTPVDELAKTMGWVEAFPPWFIPLLGGLELAAAIGLILPAAFGIVEILTPLAAVGVVLIMLGATITHLARGEAPALTITIPVLIVAAFVAWGRFKLLTGKQSAAATST